jgi:beta-glucosidase
MVAGQRYNVILEAWTKSIRKDSTKDDDPVHVFGVQPSVRLGFMEETKSEQELISDAVEAAQEADIVICVLGLNDEWESEGYDRKCMELPGAQDELIWRLLKESGDPEKDHGG